MAAVGLVGPLLLAKSAAAWLLSCALALLLVGSVVRRAILLLIDELHLVPATPGLRVRSSRALCPLPESLPMIERKLAAVQKVCCPHDTWLLDEGDDAAIELCAKLGVRHFGRKGRDEY